MMNWRLGILRTLSHTAQHSGLTLKPKPAVRAMNAISNLVIFIIGMSAAIVVMTLLPVALIAPEARDMILIGVWAAIYFGALIWLMQD